MQEKLDCVVVGAGVVGLAVARALAIEGREVVVLESESKPGLHLSGRNSEVIHAGIYYPANSLKARLCVRGKKLLYSYCEDRGVNFKQIGKVIVACSEEEVGDLAALKDRAEANGVADLRILGKAEIAGVEPAVESLAALLSPSTGIIDSSELMLGLQGDLEAAGGTVVFNSRVSAVTRADRGLSFRVGNDRLACKTLINAGGLWAHKLVQNLVATPEIHYAKAHYFSYQGKSPFEHLVYPMPSGAWLGIHATIDLGGSARFGPDISWVDQIDYEFEDGRKDDFVAAVRRYFPEIDAGKLVPAYTGVRPKPYGPGEPPTDFLIDFDSDHGVPGLVNLFGIESPGLTASLAIGEFVANSLRGQ